MKYQAIIFDMDGTIITTETAWVAATKHLLKQHGQLTDQECNELLPVFKGSSVYTTCNFIVKNFKTTASVEELIEQLQAFAYSKFEKQVVLIEGFEQFHNALSKFNLKSAIATNSDQKSLNRVLTHIPLQNFFNEHIYSIDIINKIPKPRPDIYLFAAQKLDVAPHLCIAIEDSSHGIAAAKAAGMFCIGINTGNDYAALKQADLIINGYPDILIETLLQTT